MKIFRAVLIGVAVIFLASCTKDECLYSSGSADCPKFYKMNDSLAGFTVATCYSASGIGDVAVIFDTRYNSAAVPGTDWGATITAIHPPTWKANIIGQVFGITIDNNRDIYLAASNIYTGVLFPNTSAFATVYKSSAPTWTATPLFSLPNTGGPLNGTGNIAYDKKNDQLFTTNLEDGKIYRHSTLGALLGTFDPWLADVSAAGITALDEQVWGVGVNYEQGNVKIYFPRITTAGDRELYSVTLTSTGAFPTGTNPEILEISGLPGSQARISDIAFSNDFDEMLLSERGNAHASKVYSYSLSGTTWIFNQDYFIGGNIAAGGENSAGGVDFYPTENDGIINASCDQSFWASGNFMNVRSLSPGALVYGLEGIAYAGNNASTAPSPTANQDTDLFIDFNPPNYSTGNKGSIGDVEVFDAEECFCR